ncbi:GTP-binding protein [Alcanivorax sp.]|uniref:CobW family GTP-binding protein n=1 Tax=Alcanivorax sp. TaxID=1872427 RepID=UPI0025BBF19F|nr:GTP-binding protein [Alcanivorax sp.]
MDRIPVVVLTGFLGSGKTTQLNAWLEQRQDLALLINELGDIGIDQHLTQQAGVPVTLLAGGCVCCVVQGSLSSTLRNLFMARKNGEIPAFSKVILETTGAAEPSGVLAPLEQDPWLKKRFYCQSVLTVVDVAAGTQSIQSHPECLEQIQAADLLLLSRTDQVDEAALVEFRRQLLALNPDAEQHSTPAPAALLEREFERRCRITGSLTLKAPGSLSFSPAMSLTAPVAAASRHQLYSASLIWPHRLSWQHWQAALRQLASQCGDALVRVKGLLQVEGLDGPLLVQWVGAADPELTPMNRWPDGDICTRLVLIVRHQSADFAGQQMAHWEQLLEQLHSAPTH